MAEEEIGKVTHYYGHISVAVVELSSGTLVAGDTIHIVGHTTDLTQKVGSMQLEHAAIESIKAGEAAAIKVDEHVREHDVVFKVTD